MKNMAWMVPALLIPSPSTAQHAMLNIYPAMRSGGASYVINTGPGGNIVKCQPLDPAEAEAVTQAACQALTGKGVPDTVKPATPMTNPGTWVTPSDYPTSALRRQRSGTVQMLYEVSTEGRVTQCGAYKTSGDGELDQAACAAMIARARFKPATFKGQPVPGVGITAFNFFSR